jgi:hypothetical protein
MELNADFSRRVVVHAAQLPWVPSAMAGVERRRHATRPARPPGCTLFVKLRQFDPADRQQVEIDTSAMPYQPATDRPGVELLPLFRDEHEDVRLERWAPGGAITLDLPGGAELLVLNGAFDEGGE